MEPSTSSPRASWSSQRFQGRNPLEIKVTLKRILEFVGSDHRSLLTCRLVDPLWNTLAVEVLKEKGSTVTVGCDIYPSGIVKGDRYIRRKFGADVITHSSQFQYICHNKNKTKNNRVSSILDRLTFNLHVNFFYLICAPKILRGIHALSQIHIRSLVLTDENEFTDSDSDFSETIPFPVNRNNEGNISAPPPTRVVQLLRLCGPTLENFKYTTRANKEFELSLNDKPNSQKSVHWMPAQFPKLKSMSIFVDDGAGLKSFLLQVANSAPSLRNFSFTQSDQESSPLQNRNLGRLRTELSPAICAQIQELTITIPGGWITPNTLEGLEFSRLKKLVMTVSPSDVISAPVSDFLWLGLPSLTSFECRLLENEETPLPANPAAWLQPFPRLPKLEHFGFALLCCFKRSNSSDIGLITRNELVNQFLRFVGDKCINIRSVSLDLDTVSQLCTRRVEIGLGLGLESPLYARAVFPSVTSLTLTGDMYSDEIVTVTGQPEMIRAMFPGLVDITIHLERDIYLEEPPPSRFVARSYLSGVLRVPGIQRLVLKMYHKRWLADPDIDASIIGPSLEQLDLRQPKIEHWINKLEPFSVADLRIILAKFPKLKEYGVETSIFRDNGTTTSNTEIIVELRQLKKEFPAVNIKFL